MTSSFIAKIGKCASETLPFLKNGLWQSSYAKEIEIYFRCTVDSKTDDKLFKMTENLGSQKKKKINVDLHLGKKYGLQEDARRKSPTFNLASRFSNIKMLLGNIR